MQVRISNTLAGIIARTAFITTKERCQTTLNDRLADALLGEQGSLAYQLLTTCLEEWELYQIRLRLKQALHQSAGANDDTTPHSETTTLEPERHFRQLCNLLCAKYHNARSITTAHALREIIADPEGLTAPILARYRVTLDRYDQLMAEAGRTMIDQTIVGLIHPFKDNDDPDLHQDDSIGEEQQDDNPFVARKIAPLRQLDHTTDAQATDQPRLIDKLGTDLTAEARNGTIDLVVGRDREIERLIQILARRKKNNPILVGEAGVGKTAIVEGLALRMAAGEVPSMLQHKRLVALDIAALVAGTKFRGEFEERMQQLIDELRNTNDTILFIDEIHTIVGSGASQGSLDVANILKPALARGELQTIGATTFDEYRDNIERDAALARRFQRIQVDQPSAEVSLGILRKVAPHYEQHHGVSYTDEALQAAVSLSIRYQSDRQLPDKAIDLIDEAGAQANLRTDASSKAIDRAAIEQLITAATGIPIERIGGSEQQRLLGLKNYLEGRVIGQPEAVNRIAASILRARTGLREAHRPIGVFLFVGPTGVGKTLLAKELSRWLFDEHRGLIRLDMSEYAEKHSIARLIGSPPGYVGYGEGGLLTEAVRRQPYAVVLLDEIEKAHRELFHTLLQLFDEGQLTDGSGRKVDFRNTLIVMTSNIGSREARSNRPMGFTAPTSNEQHKASKVPYQKALEQTFAPELLNRIDEVICFRSLTSDDVAQIIDLELGHLTRRSRAMGYTLRITQRAKQRLAGLGYRLEDGARALKRTLRITIEEPMAQLILTGALTEGDVLHIESDRSTGIRLRVGPKRPTAA